MNWLALVFPAALVVLGLVLLVGLRQRVLARMAFRNALRRPRQSLLVILGLLVGTAIISASLVATDSMEYAIVEATYDAFQEIDETVYLDGYNFFSQDVERALANDSVLAPRVEAVGSNIIYDAAVTDEGTDLYEPSVRMVGFDPATDRAFGPFRKGGQREYGDGLAPDEVILHADLAERLGARIGHTLTLNFSQSIDPLFPTAEQQYGTARVAPPPLLPPPAVGARAEWEGNYTVQGTVELLSVVLAWTPMQGQDLDFLLESPDGQRTYTNTTGTDGLPTQVPFAQFSVLNVTGTLAHPVPRGAWHIEVWTERGVETEFNLTFVRWEPVFDLDELQDRIDDLERQYPDFDLEDFRASIPQVTKTVRVAWVFEEGKGPNFKLPNALNLFLRLDTLQSWLGREGQVNFVKVSNPGGVEGGVAHADEVYVLLWERLNATKAAHPDDPAIQELRVGNDKVFWLQQAAHVGELFGVFLTFIGSFSVIAGLLLIINIFTMLAEERKTELGMSRAVGLQRKHLRRLFTLEGAYYAVPAAFLGTLLGLGLAAGLIWGFNAFTDEEVYPAIPYRLEPTSLTLAFGVGVLLTLATIYVGARRASRLNVVRAIRNLEEPEHLRGTPVLVAGALLVAAGAAATLVGLLQSSPSGVVLGPAAVTVGLGLLLRRIVRRRVLYPPLAVLLFVYYAFRSFHEERFDTMEANIMGPVQAILMALCLVVILVYSEALMRGVGRAVGAIRALRPVALVATSYPLQRKFRTGMTLAMFGVILLVVSLFTIFGALFTPNPEKEAGGYHIEATSNDPVQDLESHGSDPSVLADIEHYDVLPYFLLYGGTLVRIDGETPGHFGPPQDTIYGINESFAVENEFALLRRSRDYATDEAAYLAVAQSDDLVIVAYPYSTDERGQDDVHQVGDRLQVEARGGVREFTIVGIQEQIHFEGIFVSRDALAGMFTNTDTLFLLRVHPGIDVIDAAKRLEASYRDIGLNAGSIRQEVLDETRAFTQIFTLIRLFLGLGLIVGILSLGIVTARSVIERRQEIGMMRALGYRRRDIRRAFLLEMLTTVGLGALIGASVAIVVSLGLWFTVIREQRIPYTLPVGDLLIIAAIAFVATTLATLAPIVRASRIPPAEALRYIE